MAYKNQRCVSLLRVLVTALFFSGPAAAQMFRQPPALKGLHGVSVAVHAGLPGMLSKDDMTTLAELRLRSAGIPILECSPKAQDAEGRPFRCVPQLYVEINGFGMNGFLTYIIKVECNDVVTTSRSPSGASVIATIWLDHDLQFHFENDNTKALFREEVGKLLDHFANDYLKANPKNAALLKNE